VGQTDVSHATAIQLAVSERGCSYIMAAYITVVHSSNSSVLQITVMGPYKVRFSVI